MKARLPRTVSLGHYKIHVVLASQTILREVAEEDESSSLYDGCWVPDYKEPVFGTIYVDAKLSAKKKWDVFFHELVHAVNDLHAWVAQELTV